VAVATASPVAVAPGAPDNGALLKVQAQAPIEIAGLPAFRLEVVDVDDPIEVGAQTTFKIDVTNQGSLPGTQVGIIAYVPAEMQIISANGPGVPKVEGQKITFPPVDQVKPGQQVNYTVVVKALKVGSVKFKVELRSLTLGTQPVVEEESTTIYGPLPGGGTPPTPAPGSSPTTAEPPPASDVTPAAGSAPPPPPTGPAPMPIPPAASGPPPAPSSPTP
jgi:hypothetical protein